MRRKLSTPARKATKSATAPAPRRKAAAAAPAPKPAALERYRVPILDRTLDLLERLSAQAEGLTLTQLTEALHMPKNSVFRIATTLTLRGYVERDEGSKAYRLSRKLLAVSHAALGGRRLLEAAAPVLLALREATGETALLGTLSGTHGVVLDQVPASHPVKVVVEIGHAFPLTTAAPAKAMLAFMPPAAQQALVAGLTFPRRTRYSLTSARAYMAELARVRSSGYALDRGEESEAYTCAAAPVFDHRGQVMAALWISGPSDRLPISQLPASAAVVRAHAARLSAQLGFVHTESS